MMRNTLLSQVARTPEEIRQDRYLDALIAFRPMTGLRMEDPPAPTPPAPAPTPTPPAPTPPAPAPGTDPTMATDEQGRSLGFPKDTRVADMADAEQAAYWRNESRKHQGRYENLTGGKSFDETRADLDAYQQIQREQQTPAEQALTDARTEGQRAGQQAAYSQAATAIFQGALEAAEIGAEDIAELTRNFNVAGYVSDAGVDAAAIAAFAKRFTPGTGSGGGTPPPRRRDFGGGPRPDPQAPRGSAGKAEAEKRFGSKTPTQ